MNQARRIFLCGVASATAAGLTGALVPAQNQSPRPVPPDASNKSDDTIPLPNTKAMLEDNQKDIKKNVEKLFQLAGDLKAEVEKTNSAHVLSLSLVRKAEEIEKLAHEIKTRAKG
jgi:hypothetical protein